MTHTAILGRAGVTTQSWLQTPPPPYHQITLETHPQLTQLGKICNRELQGIPTQAPDSPHSSEEQRCYNTFKTRNRFKFSPVCPGSPSKRSLNKPRWGRDVRQTAGLQKTQVSHSYSWRPFRGRSRSQGKSSSSSKIPSHSCWLGSSPEAHQTELDCHGKTTTPWRETADHRGFPSNSNPACFLPPLGHVERARSSL